MKTYSSLKNSPFSILFLQKLLIMQTSKYIDILFYTAAFVTFGGIIMHISAEPTGWKLVTLGASGMLLIRLFKMFPKHKNNPKPKYNRLPMYQLLSSSALILAAYFMFKESNTWGAAVLFSAIMEFYISLRLQKENK